MLLPGVARAEGDDSEDITLSLVEAAPTGDSGSEASYLFDGNTSTDWYINFSSSAYVIFKASKAIVVDGYTITSGSHSSSCGGTSSQNPKSWILSASNDLKNWTAIGQVYNDNTLRDKNSTPFDFDGSSNGIFYKYFKWEITDATYHIEISEFSLMQKAAICPGHHIEKVEAKAATCVDMGNVEYYKCSICQQAFKDEAGTDAYTDDSYILAATGHDWQGEKCSTCSIGALKYIETEGGVAFTGFENGYSTSQLVIPATHDGKSVVAIGSSAFLNNAVIESVEIPSSVQTIGDFAFSRCTSLTAVTFADDSKLETIGKSAFSYSNLSKMEIPSSVTEIGDESFLNCDKLSSVTFPSDSKLEVIGERAFMQSKLSKIKIPSSLKKIEIGAFRGCDNLYSISFPSNGKLKEIEESAFSSCMSLLSIEIPASVEIIGNYAFSDAALASVTFATNSNLKIIGERAFQYLQFSSIELPASLETIGKEPFAYCRSLYYITLKRSPKSADEISGYNCNLLAANDNVKLYVQKEGADIYREVLSNYADRILGTFVSEGLVYGEGSAKDGLICVGFSGELPSSLVIPSMVDGSSVIAIGNGAFQKTSLESVQIPTSVLSIGKRAFEGCRSLTSVVFSEGSKLRTIAAEAFIGSGISNVCIPASVETLDIGVFASCSSLTSVTIEDGSRLKTIGSYAFYNTAIENLNIPASVETIGDFAVFYCESLTSITFNRIPVGENSILGYSSDNFHDCNKLTTVNVTSGCENAYKTQLNLGDNVTITGQNIVDNGLKFAVNTAMNGLVCTGFSGDENLEVVIPKTVQGLPVTDVKEGAFAGCETVEQITILGDATSIASSAFHGMDALKHIFVKNDAYSHYKSQNFENADKLVVYEKDAKLELADAKGLSELENPTLYDPKALSYSRKVETTNGEYATLCLPFAIKLSESQDVFEKVYVPLNTMIHDKAHSDETKESFILMLKEQEADAEIPAGQPMFVKLAAGKDEFTFTNQESVTLQKDMEPSAFNMTVLDWDGASGLMTENKQFDISYTSHYLEPIAASAEQNIWSFNDNGTFGPQTEGNLNPFRLFLHVEDATAATQAKAYSISIGVGDGTTTGIREIISSDANRGVSSGADVKDGIIYDLNGRKVATVAQAKSLPKGVYILNGKKMVIN